MSVASDTLRHSFGFGSSVTASLDVSQTKPPAFSLIVRAGDCKVSGVYFSLN